MTKNNAIDALVKSLNEVAIEACEKICKYREEDDFTDEFIKRYCEECPLRRITY